MDTWLVIHHQHGGAFAAALVESDHEPKDDEVIRALDLEHAPGQGESITVQLVDKADVPVLPATQPK
jgi:hypothetical protein